MVSLRICFLGFIAIQLAGIAQSESPGFLQVRKSSKSASHALAHPANQTRTTLALIENQESFEQLGSKQEPGSDMALYGSGAGDEESDVALYGGADDSSESSSSGNEDEGNDDASSADDASLLQSSDDQEAGHLARRSERPKRPKRPKRTTIQQKWKDVNGEVVIQQRPIGGEIRGKGGPVIISLHGNGGSGESAPEVDVPNSCWFKPDGYVNSWNVGGEESKAPDVDFISEIVNEAEGTPGCDVSKGVTVLGHSNGCALIHRLLIESHDSRLKKFGCSATTLNTFQYNELGQFQKKKAENACDGACTEDDWEPVAKPPMRGRILYNMLGGSDPLVPIDGGYSGVSGGVTFLPAEESIKVWKNVFDGNAAQFVDPEAGHSIEQNSYWEPKAAELIALASPA